jgi:amidase
MTDELWSWSAVDLAQAIRRREVSAREAVTSCLERIESVNPRINAVVETRPDEALAAADAADAAMAAGEPLGPLHGVPVTTKVNTDLAGYATTNGVEAFADAVAEEDAPPLANWRRAGAIFTGRTNTPAFSIRWFTDNALHGRTLNPWDAGRTPGGSSGGAAAAVAGGMGPLSQGNDIGGSIRYPAAACGVVGLRPTVGRVPSWLGPHDGDQLLGVQSMLVQGPLARTVADVRLGLSAMATYDPTDPVCVPAPEVGPPLTRPIHVSVVRSVGLVSPDPAVDQAISAAAGWLSDAGYIVEEVELPLLADAWRLWWQLVQGIEFRAMEPDIEKYGDDGIRRSVRNQFAFVENNFSDDDLGLDAYLRGYGRRSTLVKQLSLFLQRSALVLLPISAERTFEVDADVVDVSRCAEVITAQWPMMSIAALGFPALSVPATIAGGLPVGVQLLGRRFREDTLLDAGAVIEQRAQVTTPIDPH